MSKVFLLEHSPNPEKILTYAAKVCYSNKDIEDIGIKEDEIPKFIKMLLDMEHGTPFEHNIFTFGISNISRDSSHQLVRMRIGTSIDQKSQRYVKEDQFDYIIPLSIYNSKHKDKYIQFMKNTQLFYNEMDDIPNEDRRYVLPGACETQLVMSMNIRSLMHFFKLRCCMRSQWEIRNIAKKMLLIVRKIAPNVFNYIGPKCFIYGHCSEGKRSCGKIKEIKEIFSDNEKISESIKEIN